MQSSLRAVWPPLQGSDARILTWTLRLATCYLSRMLNSLRYSVLIPLVGLSVAMFGGCGSSDDDSSNPNTNKTVTCTDVCGAVTQKCGATPPNCEATCAGFSEEQKSCVVDADSCQAIENCGNAQPEDAGTDAPKESSTQPGPCDNCTSEQFCVTSSSVQSELGCYTPPSSCNGSTTSFCPCIYAPNSGPCSKGTASCSEGMANAISCN